MHLELDDRDVLGKTSDGFLVVGSIREMGFDCKAPFFFMTSIECILLLL